MIGGAPWRASTSRSASRVTRQSALDGAAMRLETEQPLERCTGPRNGRTASLPCLPAVRVAAAAAPVRERAAEQQGRPHRDRPGPWAVVVPIEAPPHHDRSAAANDVEVVELVLGARM